MSELLDVVKSPSVLVYTMGKVASTSLSAALRAGGVSCADIHFLEQKRIVKNIRNRLAGGFVPRHLIESLVAANGVTRRARNGHVIKVVTCVRPAVQRNLSAVFHGLPQSLEHDLPGIRQALKQYALGTADAWFAEDFTPVTGIDPLTMDLDRTRDHFRFSNERFDVLVLKVDISDEAKSELVSDFVGRAITVKRENVGARKWYADIYRQFMSDSGNLDPAWVRDCLAARYFNAFYSPEEQAQEERRFLVRADDAHAAAGVGLT